jgi:hypothetical protein
MFVSAALMDEQFAEKLQKAETGDTQPDVPQEKGPVEDIDEELALALALSLSEAADIPSEGATDTPAAGKLHATHSGVRNGAPQSMCLSHCLENCA